MQINISINGNLPPLNSTAREQARHTIKDEIPWMPITEQEVHQAAKPLKATGGGRNATLV